MSVTVFDKENDSVLGHVTPKQPLVQGEIPSAKTFNRRWYDRHENVTRLITHMGLFPMKIQEVLCSDIANAVESMFRIQEIQSSRSIGLDKILRLWGSKRKLRGYDQNQSMHKVVTYLSILPEVNCEQVAGYSNALVDNTIVYLQTCVREAKPVLITEVHAMSQTFFKQYAKLSPLKEGGAAYKKVAERLDAQVSPAEMQALEKGIEPKSLPMPSQMQPNSDIIIPSGTTWVDLDDMRIRPVHSEPGWAQ